MPSAPIRLVRSAWRVVIDTALPPRCPGCGVQVDGDHRFCVACWSSLEFLGDPACIHCGAAAVIAGEPCEACRVRPPAFTHARAAVAYGEVARTVALRLKYGRRPGVARTMAALMARLTGDLPADAVYAAVPLHRERLWSRGYNQALLIARALARRSGHRTVPDLLVRTRATPALRGMGRGQRADTVRGVFAVPASHVQQVAGRLIVLVDDVFTTGATVEACAAVLRAAGAREVRVLCWARVVHDR